MDDQRKARNAWASLHLVPTTIPFAPEHLERAHLAYLEETRGEELPEWRPIFLPASWSEGRR